MADDIWTLARSARMHDLRDSVHFELLRAGEVLRRPRIRRAAYIAATAAAVIAVIAVRGAGAADTRHDAQRSGAPAGLHLLGTAAAQTLDGSPRSDRLEGRAGNDVLLGHGGADVLIGGRGADVLEAGAGGDQLVAGPGRDVLVGGRGNDLLRASEHDGVPDRLHCGPGDDSAWVVSVNGRVTDTTYDCEHVTIVTVRTIAARARG